MEYAAAISADSEHPIARALRQIDAQVQVVTKDIRNIPGAGISAFIDGSEWRFGKQEYAVTAELGNAELQAQIDASRAKGQTVSLLSNAQKAKAIFIFEDPLRPGIKEMLQGLRDASVTHFSILSGDAQSTVMSIGEQLGIDDCHGGMSPPEKLAWVASKQAEGYRVAMFGDGINDAPALAAADISISFSAATDLANVSSDFLVLGKDASVLADARVLASRTRRNIMQNFSWAAAYNFIAVPFAALGMIPPWGAAIGMSLSSLFVVTNALRLRSSKN